MITGCSPRCRTVECLILRNPSYVISVRYELLPTPNFSKGRGERSLLLNLELHIVMHDSWILPSWYMLSSGKIGHGVYAIFG